MATIKGGEGGKRGRAKKEKRSGQQTGLKERVRAILFGKPQPLKGSPSNAGLSLAFDFIEHHKRMETFHENMDAGKKHVCVSAKTLLRVANN